MKKVVLIGSGNVATHLGGALVESGIEVIQVWSYTLENASILANKLGSEAINDVALIDNNADAYIFSVKDDALISVLESFPYGNKVLLHTAGSISIDVLKPFTNRCGVLYPLQTFSKAKEVDFSTIPLLLEASDDDVMGKLKSLSSGISSNVTITTSDQRKFLHIAAVFACNFTNYFYSLAEDVLSTNGLDFELIRPLILETAQKAMLHSPSDVQTGPAVRKDTTIVNSHMELLEGNPELQTLYGQISERIMKM